MSSYSLLLAVALACLCATVASTSPSGVLLWSESGSSALSSLSSLSSLALADYNALILLSSQNQDHRTASSTLLDKVTNAAASRFLSHSLDRSVSEIISSLLLQVPDVVVVSISSKAELDAFTLPEAGKFLHVKVNLPGDVAEADAWTEAITAKVTKFGKEISIFAAAPKPDVITEFIPRVLQRDARGMKAVNGTGGLFEVYTFFSDGVWMGIVAGVLILFILVPALMCLSDLQTPTKFEKNS